MMQSPGPGFRQVTGPPGQPGQPGPIGPQIVPHFVVRPACFSNSQQKPLRFNAADESVVHFCDHLSTFTLFFFLSFDSYIYLPCILVAFLFLARGHTPVACSEIHNNYTQRDGTFKANCP